MKEPQRIRLMILIFGIMFLIGWIDNIRGVLIPSIKAAFDVNYTSLASMMLLSTLGYVCATFTGGILTDRVGHRTVVLIGFLIVVCSIWGISAASIFYYLVAFMVVLGYGMGLLVVGASTLAPVIFIKNQGIMMNLFHFFYGVGATIGPRYAGSMLTKEFTWNQIYLYSLLMIGSFFLYYFFCRFPKVESRNNEKVPLKIILKDKRVILFSIALGFYVAAEVGIGNWFVTYLQNGRGLSELQSASYLSAFYIIFTIGRLVGGFVVEKIGYLKSVRYAAIGSIILLLLGIFSNKNWIALISASGLFFSIIYPTTMTIVMRTFDKGLNTIIGVVMTTASAVNMLTNWIIGRTNDMFGEAVGFGLIPFYQIISLLLILLIQYAIQNNKQINA